MLIVKCQVIFQFVYCDIIETQSSSTCETTKYLSRRTAIKIVAIILTDNQMKELSHCSCSIRSNKHYIKFVYISALGFIIEEEGRTKYQCPDCGRSYSRKPNLTKHQRYECGKEPMFPCPACPYRAKHKSKLRTHMCFKHPHLLRSTVR